MSPVWQAGSLPLSHLGIPYMKLYPKPNSGCIKHLNVKSKMIKILGVSVRE